ncbi:alkyldihydroxyacetonephosphate synthase isoform X2 [Plutella xylostella]|uniref:alkyldihydroxyacetonephosphate synthase isoform X1 n=1 Tax=Plutella xylostella TaxID=51655 RepID=UPI0020331680|nr:alkyldihydroxyacetonephosphate synthase isoform X1 [Plutella xylostella]XP_037965124.2 alkyldihydroxyacetonephosphate synthase isoform X2 [Plutella xylostella]
MSAIPSAPEKIENKMDNNDNVNTRTETGENNKLHNDKKKKTDPNSVSTVIKVKSVIPRRRQDLLKWHGWGYNDSKFTVDYKKEMITFTGNRYAIGGKFLPNFIPFVLEYFDIDLNKERSCPRNVQPQLPKSYHPSRLPANIKEELEKIAPVSVEGLDRFVRAHGQTLRDIAQVRANSFKRIPDAVVWPTSHDEVEAIVRLACKHNLVIIPYGGGTSVSGAITCPAREPRPILALDTSGMNSILWIDKEQLLARIQAGIVGQDLEREMRARGFTVGHEPDSYEFSTLGGWVATRASGMKKNTYGNIEDLIVQTKVVTPKGVIEKGCSVPRISSGPEWEHVIMGSEGCFGVVTEVTLKIRPLPPVVRYASLVFPDWDSGFHFMREVARHRLQPSSIRLMDNEQFRFGLALKTESSWGGVFLEGLKMAYITRIKGFNPRTLAVVTLLIEGATDEVNAREKRLNSIAAQTGGVPAGATNGERGYTLTFVIAYIRDMALDWNIVAESFETSVPWERTLALCRNVKWTVRQECEKRGIKYYLTSHRLTQTYDAGCCIYFYFGFNSVGMRDPVAAFEEIEEAARDAILASGGSISHHHGVGKVRKKWYKETVGELGRELLLAAKKTLDPDNIFALANMAFDEHDADTSPPVKSKL